MKKMAMFTLTGSHKALEDRVIYIDPFQISTIASEGAGSVITMKQRQYFKIIEPPREVYAKCGALKKASAQTTGQEED